MTRFLLLLLGVTPILSMEWEQIQNSNPPPARSDHGLGFHSQLNRLIVFGGRTGAKLYSDTWIFDLTTSAWREVVTSTQPEPRFSFVSGVSGDYFYVSTGQGMNGDERLFYNDIWRFNFKTEKWDRLPHKRLPPYVISASFTDDNVTVPESRYGSAGGVYPGYNRFYIALGFDHIRYSNVYSYDLTDELWTEDYPDRPPYAPGYPHARCLHSGAMIDPVSFVIFGGCLTGGKSGGACPSGDTWLFDGQKREWEKLEPCAEPRVYSSMAMLTPQQGQRRVVLYGGGSDRKQVIKTTAWKKDEIGVFNPDDKTWKLVKIKGSHWPKRRMSTTLVTHPDGIYMFGGHDLETDTALHDLWLLRGSASDTDSLEISRDCSPFFMNYLIVHGIFMFIGWGCFLQWGAFVARYLRAKDPLWFHLHRIFQVTGLVVAFIGFILAFVSVQFDHMKFAHAIIGLFVMIVGIGQPLNALCRPHIEKDKPKSTPRGVWELFHHFLGRSALILAIVNISLGVFLANASRPVYSLWFAYLSLLICCYIVAEINRLYRKRREKKFSEEGNVLMLESSNKL